MHTVPGPALAPLPAQPPGPGSPPVGALSLPAPRMGFQVSRPGFVPPHYSWGSWQVTSPWPSVSSALSGKDRSTHCWGCQAGGSQYLASTWTASGPCELPVSGSVTLRPGCCTEGLPPAPGVWRNELPGFRLYNLKLMGGWGQLLGGIKQWSSWGHLGPGTYCPSQAGLAGEGHRRAGAG